MIKFFKRKKGEGEEKEKGKNIILPHSLLSLKKTNTLYLIVIILQLVLTSLLISVISALIPLKEKIPFFINVAKINDEIIKPVSYLEMTQDQFIIEKFLTEYIKDRETIDHLTEYLRYQKIYNMTSGLASTQFKENYLKEKIKISEKPKRKVYIVSTAFYFKEIKIGEYNLFQAKFYTEDFYSNSKQEKNNWQVNIGFTLQPQSNMSVENLKINPTGILISEYQIEKINNDITTITTKNEQN